MMKKNYLYDEQSHELAKYFLAGNRQLNTPEKVDSLAHHIQDTVEDWFSREESELDPEP